MNSSKNLYFKAKSNSKPTPEGVISCMKRSMGSLHMHNYIPNKGTLPMQNLTLQRDITDSHDIIQNTKRINPGSEHFQPLVILLFISF